MTVSLSPALPRAPICCLILLLLLSAVASADRFPGIDNLPSPSPPRGGGGAESATPASRKKRKRPPPQSARGGPSDSAPDRAPPPPSPSSESVGEDEVDVDAPPFASAPRRRAGGSGSAHDAGAVADGRMPTLFPSADEAKYDRYAACLAATEGLRKARDASLSRRGRRSSAAGVGAAGGVGVGGGGVRSFLPFRMGGGSGEADPDGEEAKRARAEYVLRSSRVIRALGLTVSQFNQLGREVGNDPALKERVMEQAYLYRMAATLDMDKVPLIEDPDSERLLKAHRRRRVQMFARSMTEIEELRAEQMERLRRALNVDRLPDGVNICDPSVLPILSPKVRAVCEAFPLQAEEIVKKYGLNSDEFNRMLEETRCNPIFRWRVKKYMGKSGEKAEK